MTRLRHVACAALVEDGRCKAEAFHDGAHVPGGAQ